MNTITPLRSSARRSRRTLHASVMSAALLLAAACSSDDTAEPATLDGAAAEIVDGECVATTGDEVVVYSGRKEELIKPVIDAFACETGIEAKVRYGDSAELALLLAEEGERTPAEVFLAQSPGALGGLAEEDLLAALPADTIAKVDADAAASDATWVAVTGRRRSLVYNTDSVYAASLPTSIDDLTTPDYKGRVAIAPSNSSFVDWFTVLRSRRGDAAASAWLDAMVDNGVQTYDDNRSIVEAVGRGEIDFGLVNHYYNLQLKESEGDAHKAENHDFAAGDDGAITLVSTASITKTGADSEPAKKLVDFMLDPRVQRYFTEDVNEYPVAVGVEPAAGLSNAESVNVGSVDLSAIAGGLGASTEAIEASGILAG